LILIIDVYPAKKFPGMEESTPLSKAFAEQGLKIRIRKEVRARNKPKIEYEMPSKKRIRDEENERSSSSSRKTYSMQSVPPRPVFLIDLDASSALLWISSSWYVW
jgi:hypothetical protein